MKNTFCVEDQKKHFDSMPIAFTIIEVILDDNHNPIDFIFRYANSKLAQLEGLELEDIIDKKFLEEVFPDNNSKKWLKYYYGSAYSGETHELHEFSVEIGKYLKIVSYPYHQRGLCACILTDETEFVSAQNYLKYLAHHDIATNTYNKNSYAKFCDDYKFGKTLGVIFMDINRLKKTNDLYGHQAGDFLIRLVIDCIKSNIEMSTDKIFRIGGDEFVILVEDCLVEQMQGKVEKLRHAMINQEIPHFPEVMAAIGYSWSGDMCCVEELVSAADQCMYLDKQAYNLKYN